MTQSDVVQRPRCALTTMIEALGVAVHRTADVPPHEVGVLDPERRVLWVRASAPPCDQRWLLEQALAYLIGGPKASPYARVRLRAVPTQRTSSD